MAIRTLFASNLETRLSSKNTIKMILASYRDNIFIEGNILRARFDLRLINFITSVGKFSELEPMCPLRGFTLNRDDLEALTCLLKVYYGYDVSYPPDENFQEWFQIVDVPIGRDFEIIFEHGIENLVLRPDDNDHNWINISL